MKPHAAATDSRRTTSWTTHVLRGSALLAGSALGTVIGVGIVTVAEGFWAKGRLMPTRLTPSASPARTFGDEHSGPPLTLVMMGDSLAVGYGAEDPDQTVGVILADGLASASHRPVRLHNVAEIGAESTDLPVQLAAVKQLPAAPDVAVIIVGGNDVMHLKRLVDSLRPLRLTVAELRRTGTSVVVATCPDLGTVRAFYQPLRFFAHWLSRLLATSQTVVVLRAGGRTVSLADTLGPLFRREPTSMFSQRDRLHPSGLGYERAAAVLLPSVRAAAGYPSAEDATVPHRVYDKTTRHPLAWLAFRASRRVGAQLRPVGVTAKHPARVATDMP